jgi:hypothetical protein
MNRKDRSAGWKSGHCLTQTKDATTNNKPIAAQEMNNRLAHFALVIFPFPRFAFTSAGVGHPFGRRVRVLETKDSKSPLAEPPSEEPMNGESIRARAPCASARWLLKHRWAVEPELGIAGHRKSQSRRCACFRFYDWTSALGAA